MRKGTPQHLHQDTATPTNNNYFQAPFQQSQQLTYLQQSAQKKSKEQQKKSSARLTVEQPKQNNKECRQLTTHDIGKCDADHQKRVTEIPELHKKVSDNLKQSTHSLHSFKNQQQNTIPSSPSLTSSVLLSPQNKKPGIIGNSVLDQHRQSFCSQQGKDTLPEQVALGGVTLASGGSTGASSYLSQYQVQLSSKQQESQSTSHKTSTAQQNGYQQYPNQQHQQQMSKEQLQQLSEGYHSKKNSQTNIFAAKKSVCNQQSASKLQTKPDSLSQQLFSSVVLQKSTHDQIKTSGSQISSPAAGTSGNNKQIIFLNNNNISSHRHSLDSESMAEQIKQVNDFSEKQQQFEIDSQRLQQQEQMAMMPQSQFSQHQSSQMTQQQKQQKIESNCVSPMYKTKQCAKKANTNQNQMNNQQFYKTESSLCKMENYFNSPVTHNSSVEYNNNNNNYNNNNKGQGPYSQQSQSQHPSLQQMNSQIPQSYPNKQKSIKDSIYLQQQQQLQQQQEFTIQLQQPFKQQQQQHQSKSMKSVRHASGVLLNGQSKQNESKQNLSTLLNESNLGQSNEYQSLLAGSTNQLCQYISIQKQLQSDSVKSPLPYHTVCQQLNFNSIPYDQNSPNKFNSLLIPSVATAQSATKKYQQERAETKAFITERSDLYKQRKGASNNTLQKKKRLDMKEFRHFQSIDLKQNTDTNNNSMVTGQQQQHLSSIGSSFHHTSQLARSQVDQQGVGIKLFEKSQNIYDGNNNYQQQWNDTMEHNSQSLTSLSRSNSQNQLPFCLSQQQQCFVPMAQLQQQCLSQQLFDSTKHHLNNKFNTFSQNNSTNPINSTTYSHLNTSMANSKSYHNYSAHNSIQNNYNYTDGPSTSLFLEQVYEIKQQSLRTSKNFESKPKGSGTSTATSTAAGAMAADILNTNSNNNITNKQQQLVTPSSYSARISTGTKKVESSPIQTVLSSSRNIFSGQGVKSSIKGNVNQNGDNDYQRVLSGSMIEVGRSSNNNNNNLGNMNNNKQILIKKSKSNYNHSVPEVESTGNNLYNNTNLNLNHGIINTMSNRELVSNNNNNNNDSGTSSNKILKSKMSVSKLLLQKQQDNISNNNQMKILSSSSSLLHSQTNNNNNTNVQAYKKQSFQYNQTNNSCCNNHSKSGQQQLKERRKHTETSNNNNNNTNSIHSKSATTSNAIQIPNIYSLQQQYQQQYLQQQYSEETSPFSQFNYSSHSTSSYNKYNNNQNALTLQQYIHSANQLHPKSPQLQPPQQQQKHTLSQKMKTSNSTHSNAFVMIKELQQQQQQAQQQQQQYYSNMQQINLVKSKLKTSSSKTPDRERRSSGGGSNNYNIYNNNNTIGSKAIGLLRASKTPTERAQFEKQSEKKAFHQQKQQSWHKDGENYFESAQQTQFIEERNELLAKHSGKYKGFIPNSKVYQQITPTATKASITQTDQQHQQQFQQQVKNGQEQVKIQQNGMLLMMGIEDKDSHILLRSSENKSAAELHTRLPTPQLQQMNRFTGNKLFEEEFTPAETPSQEEDYLSVSGSKGERSLHYPRSNRINTKQLEQQEQQQQQQQGQGDQLNIRLLLSQSMLLLQDSNSSQMSTFHLKNNKYAPINMKSTNTKHSNDFNNSILMSSNQSQQQILPQSLTISLNNNVEDGDINIINRQSESLKQVEKDISTLQLLESIKDNKHKITSLLFSHSNQQLFTTSADYTFKVYQNNCNNDTNSQLKLMQSVRNRKGLTASGLFCEDTIFITGSMDGYVRLYSKESQSEQYEMNQFMKMHDCSIVSILELNNSSNNNIGLSGSLDGKVNIFNINQQCRCISEYQFNQEILQIQQSQSNNALLLSPDSLNLIDTRINSQSQSQLISLQSSQFGNDVDFNCFRSLHSLNNNSHNNVLIAYRNYSSQLSHIVDIDLRFPKFDQSQIVSTFTQPVTSISVVNSNNCNSNKMVIALSENQIYSMQLRKSKPSQKVLNVLMHTETSKICSLEINQISQTLYTGSNEGNIKLFRYNL